MSPALIPDLLPGLRPGVTKSVSTSARSEEVLARLAHAAPRAGDPVFFLLYPPPETAARIWWLASRFSRQFDLAGSAPTADRLHVSLLHLCPYARLTSDMLDAVADVLPDLPTQRFGVCFDRVMSFGRTKGPLVLCGGEGVGRLTTLRNEMIAAMRKFGFRANKHAYAPHLTLNYESCEASEQMIDELCWTVEEIVLVCSLRGRQRHVRLASWPLQVGPL